MNLEKSNFNYITIPIIQGSHEAQTVTGTGEELQSFNINVKDYNPINMIMTLYDLYGNVLQSKRIYDG